MKDKIKRIIWITLPAIVITWIYNLFQGSFESSVGTNQLQDSKVVYSFTQFISSGKLINIIWIIWLILVVITIERNHKKGEMK